MACSEGAVNRKFPPTACCLVTLLLSVCGRYSSFHSCFRYSKVPLFVTKPRSTEAVEGDTVIIHCEVVGDPKPEVMWLRDWLKVGCSPSQNIL